MNYFHYLNIPRFKLIRFYFFGGFISYWQYFGPNAYHNKFLHWLNLFILSNKINQDHYGYINGTYSSCIDRKNRRHSDQLWSIKHSCVSFFLLGIYCGRQQRFYSFLQTLFQSRSISKPVDRFCILSRLLYWCIGAVCIRCFRWKGSCCQMGL